MPGKSISVWLHESIYNSVSEISRETGLNRSAVINAILYKALRDLGLNYDEELDREFRGALNSIEYYAAGKKK